MQPPLPSLTATWHNNVYPAIDATQPELSQTGKTVVITGAGSGIGRETAITFGKAGAKHLVLIGRNEDDLTKTKYLISGATTTAIFPHSVTDEGAMKLVAQEIGTWDVLIMAAGHISSPAPIVSADLNDYWQSYETNVKSLLVIAQAFFPYANPDGASVFALTSATIALPAAYTVGLSSYLSSKGAQSKLIEYLAAENPNLFLVSVHPGLIETKIFNASGGKADQSPMDSAALPANFLVWLSQPKTKFLNGRLVWANWDVDELLGQAEKIEQGSLLTIGYQGWPFAPSE